MGRGKGFCAPIVIKMVKSTNDGSESKRQMANALIAFEGTMLHFTLKPAWSCTYTKKNLGREQKR